jgi:hypothetical protein
MVIASPSHIVAAESVTVIAVVTAIVIVSNARQPRLSVIVTLYVVRPVGETV